MSHLWINQVVGFTGKMFEKHLWKSDVCVFSDTSKNLIPGLFISGTLVDNGLTSGVITWLFIFTWYGSLRLLVAIHEKEPQNAI